MLWVEFWWSKSFIIVNSNKKNEVSVTRWFAKCSSFVKLPSQKQHPAQMRLLKHSILFTLNHSVERSSTGRDSQGLEIHDRAFACRIRLCLWTGANAYETRAYRVQPFTTRHSLVEVSICHHRRPQRMLSSIPPIDEAPGTHVREDQPLHACILLQSTLPILGLEVSIFALTVGFYSTDPIVIIAKTHFEPESLSPPGQSNNSRLKHI